MDREKLDAAIRAGIITADQAAKLGSLGGAAAAETRPAVDPDDEKFRFLGGFNDVFVTIGVALLYGALIVMAGSIAPVLLTFAGAGAAWLLAEVFTRRMRLALPSIVLAVLFASSAGTTAFIFYMSGLANLDDMDISPTAPLGWGGLILGLAGLGAAFAHHRRFQVPIDWAIGAVSAIVAVVGVLGLLVGPRLLVWSTELILAAGVATFAVAMWLDMSDPERRTRRADAAFWLHLLAAPMLVHPLIGNLAGSVWSLTVERSLLILAIFAVIAVVALVIDRRALLVSGLIYTGSAMTVLFQQAGFGSATATLAVTLLGLAAVVLSLSAGWRSLRRLLLPRLPLGSLARRLPPA
jgi:hypothetical protein